MAAGIFFLTAVALFFLMDIPKLYGEISGGTARKAIEQIRKHNAEALTGDIAGVHTESGVRTEKFSTATLAPETMDDFVLEKELSYAESVEIIE